MRDCSFFGGLGARFLLCGLILTSSVALSACVGQNRSSGEDQFYEEEIRTEPLQPPQADAMNQLQAMREELNELKGQLDDLKNAGGARALVNRVNQHDAALHQVENSMAMNFNLGEPLQVKPQTMTPAVQPPKGAEMAPVVAKPGSYGEPLVATQAGAPVAAQALGQTTGAPVAAQTPGQTTGATALPSGSTWGQESPKPQLSAPQKDLSLALYDAGLNAYHARNYAEAQRSFSDFLKNYANHSLVPDAQYYLAECYFQRNQFPEAALAYNEVITKYPKSSHAPGSYLKQGICFSKSGQKAAAQARMNELIKKYPSSPEAARAKNFLKTNA